MGGNSEIPEPCGVEIEAPGILVGDDLVAEVGYTVVVGVDQFRDQHINSRVVWAVAAVDVGIGDSKDGLWHRVGHRDAVIVESEPGHLWHRLPGAAVTVRVVQIWRSVLELYLRPACGDRTQVAHEWRSDAAAVARVQATLDRVNS